MDKAEKKAVQAIKKAAQTEKKAEKAKKKAAKKAVSAEKKAEKMKKQAQAKAARNEKKAKRRIEKQEKRAEKLAVQAGDEMEQGGKKKGNKKILFLIPVMAAAGAALVYFLVLPRLFPKDAEPESAEPEPIAAPVVYQLGTASIPALPAWGEVLVYQEKQPPLTAVPVEEPDGTMPETISAVSPASDGETEGEPENTEGAGAEDEAEPEEPEITSTTYRYAGFNDPLTLMASYAELMTTEDAGFSFVDEDLVRLEEEEYPALDTASGRAYLARNAFTEEDAGKAMTIRLYWTTENCYVTLDLAEGSVRNPPPPPTPAMSGSGMTAIEAMDFIYSMDPADLGLGGSSMEDYTIYAVDGVVMIDDIPCMRMSVYSPGQSSGNEIAGDYFISADGQHIYRLDVENNRVEELDSIG